MEKFQIPCPMCGEPSANIELQFHEGQFHCADCSGDFTLELISELVALWSQLLPWLKAMPDLVPYEDNKNPSVLIV